MNILRIILLQFLSFISISSTFGQDSLANRILVPEVKGAFPIGDMNNDKISDTIFVVTPAYYSSADSLFDSCINDSCYNKIIFSCGLPEIYYGNSLWGRIELLEDLNGDGVNEILFETGWFIGTHISIYIYSFVNGQWNILAKNFLYGEDNYSHRIQKINNKKFKFTIEKQNSHSDYIQKTIQVKTIKKKR